MGLKGFIKHFSVITGRNVHTLFGSRTYPGALGSSLRSELDGICAKRNVSNALHINRNLEGGTKKRNETQLLGFITEE